MRVLFVGPFPWPSSQGSQAYLVSQAKALVRRGHDVTIAVYGAGHGGQIPGATLVRARRIPRGDFPDGGLHWSRPLHDLAMATAIRRHVRHHPADVIHAHNIEGPLISALARTGLPVIYDLHTRMADELRAHLPRGTRHLGRPIGALLDRAATLSADAGCAISERAERALIAAQLPTVRVGPAVDVTELVPRPDAARRLSLPTGPKVAYTGNLDRYQDLPLLFDAMGGIDATLVVVTNSTRPLPPGVHAVRGGGFQDALDVLSLVDLAVIPRRHCEGFPIKLLNHLGMGVPTVMIDTAAVDLPGVVPCREGDLHVTISGLLTDTARRTQLSEEAKRAVRADYDLQAMGERLEQLYASVCGDSSR